MSSRERSFFQNARDITLGVGAFVGAVAAVRAANEYKYIDESADRRGEVVRGADIKHFVTDMGTYDEIPVRSDPTRSESNIVGYVPSDKMFAGQEVFGVVYPSFPENLGNFEYDGKSYGSWYRGESLPLYEKNSDGNLVPKLDEEGNQVVGNEVYIAGNFLRLATEKEIAELGSSTSQ